MRDLFCFIITSCPDVKDRLTLWNNHKDEMSEDFLYEKRKRYPNADFQDVHNEALIYIEAITGVTYKNFGFLPVFSFFSSVMSKFSAKESK